MSRLVHVLLLAPAPRCATAPVLLLLRPLRPLHLTLRRSSPHSVSTECKAWSGEARSARWRVTAADVASGKHVGVLLRLLRRAAAAAQLPPELGLAPGLYNLEHALEQGPLPLLVDGLRLVGGEDERDGAGDVVFARGAEHTDGFVLENYAHDVLLRGIHCRNSSGAIAVWCALPPPPRPVHAALLLLPLPLPLARASALAALRCF